MWLTFLRKRNSIFTPFVEWELILKGTNTDIIDGT